MVNMDGVALGNYRGNFSGYDLNRCWLRPDPVRHPEVTVIKEFIRKLARKQPIELILDLHGHSRKYLSVYLGWAVSSTATISAVTMSCIPS